MESNPWYETLQPSKQHGADHKVSSAVFSRSFSTMYIHGILKAFSSYGIVKALLRPKHKVLNSRKGASAPAAPYALISTGTRLVADAKLKLRAAVISDEMRKSILLTHLLPFFSCLHFVIYHLEELGEYNHSKDGIPCSRL